MNTLKKFVGLFLLITGLWGCGGGQSDPPSAGGQSVSEKLYVSVSGEGAVKSFKFENTAAAKGGFEKSLQHATIPTTPDATIDVKSSSVPAASPAEMVFSEGMAYVALSNTDPGFIQMFDVASDGINHNHPIAVGRRPVHMYLDPEEKIWQLNDGPSGDPAPDSVSVIDKGEHSAHPVITVGNGHHKGAFSEPSALKPNVPKRAFISNIGDATISVIDNDPANTATYLQVVQTIPVGQVPHGIDFSPVSGKVYNANTSGSPTNVNVVSIIDAETLAVDNLTRGSGSGQIPASGTTHTRHVHDNPADPTDGVYVYILGAVKDTKGNADPLDDTTVGYVSVIDASVDELLSAVIARTELPEVNPDHITFSPDGKRAYITSRATTDEPTKKPIVLKDNVIVVLDTDPSSATFNQVIAEVVVGKAGNHRPAVVVSHDGHLAFAANSAETTVSVIDTEDNSVVSTIEVGSNPKGLGIVSVDGHAH